MRFAEWLGVWAVAIVGGVSLALVVTWVLLSALLPLVVDRG